MRLIFLFGRQLFGRQLFGRQLIHSWCFSW